MGQFPKAMGLDEGTGNFFPRAWDVVSSIGDAHGLTILVGACTVLLLIALARTPVPATLGVLVISIAASALLNLSAHGVDVIGKIPSALPDPAWPSITGDEFTTLPPAAFGVLILSTEAVGVARSPATIHGYQIEPNRDLSAMGVSNVLAGLSSGFVQSGGASQTAAADRAGGRTSSRRSSPRRWCC